MADRLKDFFDEGVVRSIARDLRSAYARLDERAFVAACMKDLAALELTARGGRVADVMREHLPPDFGQASDIIVRSLGPELDRTEGFGLAPLRYMPHVFFVARHGLEDADFEASMRAQYELTKRFSAEWSIRAFLVRHPDATTRRLREWAGDPNVHVRRLVSEGTRPRLPWAIRLRAFQEDPRPVLQLLELLKDDPERYVQRSVANNLNDIAKDHPDVAVATCRRWSRGAPSGRRWIVGHALRFLVKRGDPAALAALGFAGKPRVRTAGVRLSPRRVKLGASLGFSFDLVSASARSQELLVDYAVHFVKANGGLGPKTFKLSKVMLPGRGRIHFDGKVSFVQMTTRKHHPGRHRIEALVNGVAFPLAAFQVYR
jgi:3-methyladenine DNA glycosylase AlkC